MKIIALTKLLSLLILLLAPIASASFVYDRDNIQQRIVAEAKRQHMKPSLALAIAKVESNFNPYALSHAGAKGVMQIMPQTAEQVFGVPSGRLFDPDINIEVGLKFLNLLLARYDGRLDIALSHYNGGSAVKNRHGDLKVIPATRKYVDKVLATQKDFIEYDDQKIDTLRAIRLHNITRNYKVKTAQAAKPNPIPTSLETKIEKVRQWESIYID